MAKVFNRKPPVVDPIIGKFGRFTGSDKVTYTCEVMGTEEVPGRGTRNLIIDYITTDGDFIQGARIPRNCFKTDYPHTKYEL